ncbi:MAG: hypothetical protein J6A19_03505 [Oscillospiraceae bacterium]|nr:hypothetical protein [Oscillospiraceae bacterium]
MKLSKRIAAALLTGCVVCGSVQAAMPLTGFAVSSYYDSRDIVWLYDETLFYGAGETEPNANFIKALQNATGVKDYTTITFGDLEKITALNLSGLGLEYVPKIIGYMPRLKTLNLSKNKLRNGSVSDLNLDDCIALTSVDLSYNFLTSYPTWFSALNIPTKNISYNLLNTTNQRKIQIKPSVYYFGVGDSLSDKELNAFKDKILSTVTLNDDSLLPEYFYDPLLPTYNIPESEVDNPAYLRNEHIEIDLDVSSFIKDGYVSKAGTATGTVSLFVPGSSANKNIRCDFTVYFLDGSDPSTVKVRLEALIAECEKLTADTYTDPTWTVFSNQLKTAKTILEYSQNDNDMLQSAYDSLVDARKQLVAGVNTGTKKVLTDLISIAKNYKEENYTAESWKKLSYAVSLLNDAKEDASVSLEEANAAIKAFQDAQNGLVPSKEATPSVITKSEFESIYGEDTSVTRRGATRDGYKYSWKFVGTDVTKPADFNPTVYYDSKVEEQIRFEVGAASDYQLISFAETKAFPGTGELTLDVSKVYTDGVYRLYKWNTSTKKSDFIREVTVSDGIVTTTFSEGGDYFISSVLQNFQMISSNFKINHDKLAIIAGFKKKYTVADFRENIENGEAINITNADGTAVSETQYIATGMKASAPNSDVSYTLAVVGDIDGDGNCTALDAVYILKAYIEEITLDGYAQRVAADINGDGYIRADDAVRILKYCIGMD